MTNRLQEKIALITGGAGGIGAATGELFCREGAKVLLVDRDAGTLAQAVADLRGKLGAHAASLEGFAADVTDPAQAGTAVAHAVAVFGGLTTLINNAAIRYVSPIADADVTQWEKLLAVNLLGAVNFSRAALPHLRKASGASIVNISSTYALIGRDKFGAYDAAKAGLVSLTRTLAWEEAAHGVRANVICPGGTLTPFTVGRAAARGLDEAQLRAGPKPETLMGRWGEPIEIAHPILWLASDEASFITGATLAVDGGTSIK
jgi:2-hydroxycyclohexanecarboxyl-CoA dehydrogenase